MKRLVILFSWITLTSLFVIQASEKKDGRPATAHHSKRSRHQRTASTVVLSAGLSGTEPKTPEDHDLAAQLGAPTPASGPLAVTPQSPADKNTAALVAGTRGSK